MLRVKSKQRIGLSLLTLIVMLFMTVSVAHAASSYLTTWGSIYTSSTSDNAGCQLCHASNLGNLNPYGRAICVQSGTTIDARIQAVAVQNANSDGDPTGSSNIIEINENTQPGWTTTAVPIYDRDNCSISIGTETSPLSSGAQLDPTTNILVWEPLNMDIGEVPIGQTGSDTLILTNSDLQNPITINSIVFDFNQQETFGYQASKPLPDAVLQPGESMQVVISFTPVDISFAMADIRITNSSTNAPSLLYSVMGLGLNTTTTTTTMPPTTTTTSTTTTSTTTTTLGGGGTPTPTTTLPPTPTTTLPSTTTTTLPSTTTTTLPSTTTTTTLPSEDLCPDDPNKTEPGVCGCGITDFDFDGDGIEDCIDNAPSIENPDQTDSDGDGVGDVAETEDTVNDPSVASLLVNYGQDRVTISTDVNNSLEDVYTLATDQVADLPAGVTFPFDLFGFAVTGFGAGNPTTVTINLPDGEAPTTYWKYGPTPLDGTDHWYEFLYDGTTGAELDGNVITLHFVDGKRGDHDLDATNGTIVDPGGPAFVNTGGGSSSSGCFIATAAYGSYMEPHVMTLRQFRDSYLLTNRLGTTLVEAYYKYSPPMANYIAQHGVLRSAVRVGLTPLVGFSWLAMNYGMMFALAMLFSMLTIIIGTAFFIVRIREAN